MRIYCWEYPSYEEVPKEYLNHVIEYLGEDNGTSVISCGYCSEEFNLSADLQLCPHCGKDLIFPRVVPMEGNLLLD